MHNFKIRKFRTDYKISHKESLKLIIRSNQRTFKIDIIKRCAIYHLLNILMN